MATDRNYLTVEEFNLYINNIFCEEELLHNVPVVGEVSGCSVVGGHCYFTLKDKKAQVSINCFNCSKTYVPANGEAVKVVGRADYYIKNGKFSINAQTIEPFGKGNIFIQLEQLKEKLRAEGIFDDSHKKRVPLYPNRIALITSSKGAAVQDIISTVYRKNQAQLISVIDVRVQGEYVAADVVKALKNADEKNYDVIVIARGGGSAEDLFAFNDERIIRAIYDAKTPVISAIGHEIDYTLCDYVADERAITPTAAAERVGYDIEGEKRFLFETIKAMQENMHQTFADEKDEISAIITSIKRIITASLAAETSEIEKSRVRMKTAYSHSLELKTAEILHLLKLLDTLNPAKLLRSGFFKLTKDNWEISSVSQLHKGDVAELIADDGNATVLVTDIKQNKTHF